MFENTVPFVDGAKYNFFPGITPYLEPRIKISDLDGVVFLTLKSLKDFIPDNPKKGVFLKVIELMFNNRIVEKLEFSPTQNLWEIKFVDENPPSVCDDFDAVVMFMCGFSGGFKIGFDLAYGREIDIHPAL